MVRARAGSGTASTAWDRPSTDAKPGSSRSRGGRSRSTIRSAQATGALRPRYRRARDAGGVVGAGTPSVVVIRAWLRLDRLRGLLGVGLHRLRRALRLALD